MTKGDYARLAGMTLLLIAGLNGCNKTGSLQVNLFPPAAVDAGAQWAVEDLVGGTTADIKRDVAYDIESAKQGGGYIFGSSHSIAVGTKYENFMTMIDEFLKLRDY